MNDENIVKINEDQTVALDSNQCSEDEDECGDNNSKFQKYRLVNQESQNLNLNGCESCDSYIKFYDILKLINCDKFGSIGFEESHNTTGDIKSDTDRRQELTDSYILELIRKKIPGPLPLIPKSYIIGDEETMTGGIGKIFMLRRFKGQDRKIDLVNKDFYIAGIESQYQQSITLYNIFNPFDDDGELREEIVYYRDIGVDQNKALTVAEVNKNGNLFNTNKLDVKRLLKNTVSCNGKRGEDSSVQTDSLESFYKIKDEDDKTLVFESRFESGNLYSVMKVNDSEYHLCLQNDVNTMGHTQWFFFRVQNTRKDFEVKFNMLNFSKPDSLFNHGMKPLIYSEAKVEEDGTGWFRDGYCIGYYKNGIKRDKGSNYTLTFKYKFEYDNDTVFFAYCYPYTYSDLKTDLIAIERNPKMKNFCVIKSLCRSLAGNSCDYLTITNKSKSSGSKPKKAVIIKIFIIELNIEFNIDFKI